MFLEHSKPLNVANFKLIISRVQKHYHCYVYLDQQQKVLKTSKNVFGGLLAAQLEKNEDLIIFVAFMLFSVYKWFSWAQIVFKDSK